MSSDKTPVAWPEWQRGQHDEIVARLRENASVLRGEGLDWAARTDDRAADLLERVLATAAALAAAEREIATDKAIIAALEKTRDLLAKENGEIFERERGRAEAAEREWDTLREDAERYRWLVAFPGGVQAEGLARVALDAFNASRPKDVVDAAIDAARMEKP